MGFNPLPSAAMAAMMAITLIAMDGGGMLLRGMAAWAAACCATAFADGLAFTLHTETIEILLRCRC